MAGNVANRGVNVLNTIRDAASDYYRSMVPVATETNLSDVGNPILTYSILKNEFLDLLVNKIALPIVNARSFRSPLAFLKRQGSPLSTDEEEIGVNPAIAKQYDAKSTDLLAQTTPDVKVAYHRMNRQERYDCTIQFAVLRGGFQSWGGFDRLTEEIVQSLYNGNYIDEFIQTKRLLGAGVVDGSMATVEVAMPVDTATAKAFAKKARTLYNNFSSPNTVYNAWSRLGGAGAAYTSWSNKGDIYFFIRNDISAELDIEVLASAFNIDKADLLGRIVYVPDFGDIEGAENIYAIMCDKKYPVIIDKLFMAEEFRNGSNLSVNYYLHVWQTYSTSPLQNAVAFVSSAVVAAPTTAPMKSTKTVPFSVNNLKVKDIQTGITVKGTAGADNTAITGTLKFIEGGIASSGPLAGDGYFLAMDFVADDWSEYDDVKVGLNPSEGTGLVSIIDDPDKNGVFKLTTVVDGKLTQKFVIQYTPKGGSAIDVEYDLSGITLKS